MWWTADEDVAFQIDYVVDGEYVIPTAAWATVRDNSGAVITGLDTVVLDVTSTSTIITIPAADNAVPSGAEFSSRYVVVVFNYGGAQYRREMSYRLRPFTTITVGPEDVRRELGLDISELPDRDIDVYAAYLALNVEYPLEAALLAGDVTTIAANRAIAVKAAIEITWSLPFRAAVKIKAEDAGFDRMSEFSPFDIRLQLAHRLGSLLDVMEGTTTEGSPSMVVSTPTDVITGE
jgi:hypothetical protein